MAELATLARPYAEALFEVVQHGDLATAASEIDGLAAIARDPRLQQFAATPSSASAQVFDVIAAVAGPSLSAPMKNLLRALIDNGRLTALPEIAHQFHALASERSGVAEATIHSAFPIDDAALAQVVGALERRFKRRLHATVQLRPELIGGIRAVVGDEVLDTSVRARLDQMKAALAA